MSDMNKLSTDDGDRHDELVGLTTGEGEDSFVPGAIDHLRHTVANCLIRAGLPATRRLTAPLESYFRADKDQRPGLVRLARELQLDVGKVGLLIDAIRERL